jgi:hypothetical protein
VTTDTCICDTKYDRVLTNISTTLDFKTYQSTVDKDGNTYLTMKTTLLRTILGKTFNPSSYVVKISSTGKIVWIYTGLLQENNVTPQNIVVDTDGNVYLCATNGNLLLILALSSDGEVLWKNTPLEKPAEVIMTSLTYYGGSLYFIGYLSADSVISSKALKRAPLFVKLSAMNGNIQIVSSISGHGTLGVGQSEMYIGITRDYFKLSVTSDGTVNSEVFYSFPMDIDYTPRVIYVADDGSVYVTGSLNQYIPNAYGGGIYVMKINSRGFRQWYNKNLQIYLMCEPSSMVLRDGYLHVLTSVQGFITFGSETAGSNVYTSTVLLKFAANDGSFVSMQPMNRHNTYSVAFPGKIVEGRDQNMYASIYYFGTVEIESRNITSVGPAVNLLMYEFITPTINTTCSPRCYGRVSSNAQVCSGHGACIDTDQCQCQLGYTGDTCNKFSCYGIDSRNASVCDGDGICVAKDTCQCTTLTGSQCNELVINGFTISVNTTQVSSYDAVVSACKSKKGFPLAIQSAVDNSIISSYLKKRLQGVSSSGIVYLGVKYNSGKWILEKNGNEAKYTAWYPGEPNNIATELCTTLAYDNQDSSANWLSTPCNGNPSYIVCQIPTTCNGKSITDPLYSKDMLSSLTLVNTNPSSDTSRSSFRSLYAVPVWKDCYYPDTAVIYTFSQTKGPKVNYKVSGSAMLMPPYSFPISEGSIVEYEFQVKVQAAADSSSIVNATQKYTIESKKLSVSIYPANSEWSNTRTITLTGETNDIENDANPELFKWGLKSKPSTIDGTFINNLVTDTKILQIPSPAKLVPGNYVFTLQYSKNNRQTVVSEASITVTASANTRPIVSFETSDSQLARKQTYYFFYVRVTSMTTVTNVQWFYDNNIPDYRWQFTQTSDRFIAKTYNEPTAGTKHSLQVKVTNSAGITTATYDFVMESDPPTGGTLSIPNVIPMLTPVEFEAKDWKLADCTSNCLIEYQWVIESDQFSIRTNRRFSTKLSIPGLPPGNLKVQLLVYNVSASAYNNLETIISVKPITPCTSLISKAISDLDQYSTSYLYSTEANILSNAIVLSYGTCFKQPSRRIASEASDLVQTMIEATQRRFNRIEESIPLSNDLYYEYGSTILNFLSNSDVINEQMKNTTLVFIRQIMNTFDKSANTEKIRSSTIIPYVRSLSIVADSDELLNAMLFHVIHNVEYQFSMNTMNYKDYVLSMGVFSPESLNQEYSFLGSTKFSLPDTLQSVIDTSEDTIIIQSKRYLSKNNPHPVDLNSTDVISVEMMKMDGTKIAVHGLSHDTPISIYLPTNFVVSNETVVEDVYTGEYYPVCRYYNEKKRVWIADKSCVVGNVTLSYVRCDCTHLTMFMATFEPMQLEPSEPLLSSSIESTTSLSDVVFSSSVATPTESELLSESATPSVFESLSESSDQKSSTDNVVALGLGIGLGVGIPVTIMLIICFLVIIALVICILFRKKVQQPPHDVQEIEMNTISATTI